MKKFKKKISVLVVILFVSIIGFTGCKNSNQENPLPNVIQITGLVARHAPSDMMGGVSEVSWYCVNNTDISAQCSFELMEWGDGAVGGWSGVFPIQPGTRQGVFDPYFVHVYANKGTYTIKIRMKGVFSNETIYSEPKTTTIVYE